MGTTAHRKNSARPKSSPMLLSNVNRQVFSILFILVLLAAWILPTAHTSQATVRVQLIDNKTGDAIWDETFTVPVGKCDLEVPKPLLKQIEKAFGTATFKQGMHTAEVGGNTVIITVSEGLTVTFIEQPLSKPLPATDVELVEKITIHGSKAQKTKPSQPATTGVLGALCEGSKYAIIIGISDYPGAANDLEYCDDDARDMCTTLVKIYGYHESKITLLIDGEATRSDILNAITQLSEAEPADEVVFFFSGHGTKGRASDGDGEAVGEAIVCCDGYVWDGELRLSFSCFGTTRIVFIFDSCLAGGMTDLVASGRIVAMATTESGIAYEGDVWGNGQFTYYFVEEGMFLGLADRVDHDDDSSTSDVTVEEAFDYARAHCLKQTPTMSDDFENDLEL